MTALLYAFNKEKTLEALPLSIVKATVKLFDTFGGFLARIDMDRFQNGCSRSVLRGPISISSPYRRTRQNFGKANQLGYVKILILFMTKVVDIFILKTGARNEDFLQP